MTKRKSFSIKRIILFLFLMVATSGLVGQANRLPDPLKSRNYKGLNLSTYVFEDENHLSVVPAMISRTLRVLYAVKKK